MAKRHGCPTGKIRISGRCVDKNLPNMNPMVARVGGKTKMKKHLLAHVPEHKVYVEPFMGGGHIILGEISCS